MTRMLIIGPPGSGKGTQAQKIAGRLRILPVSTGDIFRANVAGRTPLGLEAQQYMDNGDLVPDTVTNEMVRARLQENDVHNGFLLDGYPRTLGQVVELDDILATNDQELTLVLHLTADQEELTRRLLARAEIEGRIDDNNEAIRRRLDHYRQQTEPILTVYAERRVLATIDGTGDIERVTDRVMAAIDAAAMESVN